ncbi:MAG: leucine-rich repeat domain-containing protein, partial [Clostridia bacterium]|nr:leucine-rich repeat domain-containing protein [Clostridia bacterium]
IPDDNSVTKIGAFAFKNCSGLESIVIPSMVTSIQGNSFLGCGGLQSIVVDRQNTVYHSEDNCLIETATKTLIRGCRNSVIPQNASVTSIGETAFSGDHQLMEMIIPSNVVSIGNLAFSNCIHLETIVIPKSVKNLGSYVFDRCGLTSVVFENVNGWKISGTMNGTDIAATDLSNPTIAATYLTDAYCAYSWSQS